MKNRLHTLCEKRSRRSAFLLCLAALLCLSAACSSSDRSENQIPVQGRAETQFEADKNQNTGWLAQKTIPVPETIEPLESGQKPVQNPGHLEILRYQSRESEHYDENGKVLEKRAIVYVPAGIEENQPLNVFFLMHGGWSDETTILGTPGAESSFKNTLDLMMEQQKMQPALIVCPTYNNLSDRDSWDYSLALRLTKNYWKELKNDLMPAVVKAYPTFSQDGSLESLQKARDHFGFGGFSMGSVCTWRVFENALDVVSAFLPSSGSVGQNGTELAEQVQKQNMQPDDFFILGMTGSEDFAASGFLAQLESMAEQKDMFIESQSGLEGNLTWRVAQGNEHDQNAMFSYFANGLQWFGQLPEEQTVIDASASFEPFTPASSIASIQADPAFEGFGRLLFPVNDGYMSGETLEDLHLTWYSEIDPQTSADVLNFLKRDALDGKPVFYDLYSPEEKQADPDLENTGLFFFWGQPGAQTAIVSAGGGFAYVGAIHDSFPVCLQLAKEGINAFALIYRPGAQTACEDLARAISLIHERKEELQISPDGYSLWGGSAGARMSAWVAQRGTEAFGHPSYPKPAACIEQYTGLDEASPDDVPTYMLVGSEDGIANPQTMQKRSEGLQALGIPSVCRIVPGLRHGFGLGVNTPV